MTVDPLVFVYLLTCCEPQHQVLDFPMIAGTQFNPHLLILHAVVIQNAYIYSLIKLHGRIIMALKSKMISNDQELIQ